MKKITKIIIACIITIVLCIVFPGNDVLLLKQEEQVEDYSLSQQVTIQNGVTEPSILVQEVPVQETGFYAIHNEWENEQGGMITGLKFLAPDGTVEYACTAESCQTESIVLSPLKAGTYRLELHILSSHDDLKTFLKSVNIVEDQETVKIDDEYTYAENATITMEYNLELRKNNLLIVRKKWNPCLESC